MDKLSQLWRRLAFYLRRDRFDRELEEEMRFHLEMKAEENRAADLLLEEARYAARRQFGNQTLLREVSRDMWGFRSLETLAQDLRYGVRMLLKSKGFTIVVALTLALGIGANTAIFSVVNAVLLRPLPYPDSDRLVHIYRMQPPVERSPVAVPVYLDFAAQQQVFESFAAHNSQTFNLTDVDEAERIIGRRVTANFFAVFGASPKRGRFFLPTDDEAGSPLVAVISDGLWRRRFGGDDGIIGQTIKLNGEAYTVIGVAPPLFQFPRRVEIWTPARLLQSQVRGDRSINFLMVIGRLKDGVTKEQAQAQMNQIASAMARQYPSQHDKLSVLVSPMLEEQISGIRTGLWVLMGAVAFVLLIACANVANLLLARASARRREFAVRVALGAGRFRVVRQLLTESMLLALLGGAGGILLAFWGVRLLVAAAPANLPRVSEARIDMWALGFTLLISLLTGFVFGLAPAWHLPKFGLNEALKEGARGAGVSLSQAWLRRVLVIAEIALSLVLLVGAGLLIGSVRRLAQINPGFETNNLLTADINYPRRPAAAYQQSGEGQERQERSDFLRAIEQKVATLPGVQSVGVINDLPVTGDLDTAGKFKIEGDPDVNWANAPQAEWKSVTPNYFNAIGIPLLKGRSFSERDTPQSPATILINETLARRFFPGEDPIGKRLMVANGPHEIVGVVGDSRQRALNLPANPEIYFPNTQHAFGQQISLVVRTNIDPVSLSDAVRRAAQSVNRDAPIIRVRTMQDVMAGAIAQARFNTILMALFAVVAMLLSAIGLYGVMAYSVTQRAHEIGIRVALGASRADVLRLVVGQGLRLVALGLGLGLMAAMALTRLMEKLLFEVSATDPATFTCVAALLILVALLACWIPARRAAKVDPIIALRFE
jgi:putative ABC transport system permease protein